MENGTYKVRVLHNEGRGHFFGYDPDTADLYLVHETLYLCDPFNLIAICEHAFWRYNVGDDPDFSDPPHADSVAYRAKRLRSLSVGDVILIEEPEGERHFMACESLGWDEIEEARQVDAGPLEDDPMYRIAHGLEPLDAESVNVAVQQAIADA